MPAQALAALVQGARSKGQTPGANNVYVWSGPSLQGLTHACLQKISSGELKNDRARWMLSKGPTLLRMIKQWKQARALSLLFNEHIMLTVCTSLR
jgi:hypothetical protein